MHQEFLRHHYLRSGWIALVSWDLGARLAFLLAFAICSESAASLADANSWVKTTSGAWEDSAWSLGAPPTDGQMAMITNAGWKAVVISQNTVQNFPQTMSIGSLVVSSPTNSFNTLLLNYAGVNTPFTMSTLTIASNSALVMLNSALQVSGGGGFSVGGMISQGDYSQINADSLTLGNIGPGQYTLTNGSLKAGAEIVGGIYQSAFTQLDGLHSVNGQMQINSGSQFNIYGGWFTGGSCVNGGVLNIYGGSFNSGSGLGVDGSCLIAGGMFWGAMTIPASFGRIGSVVQTGGTNQCALIIGDRFVNNGFPGLGSYTLSNGVVITTGTTLDYSGNFTQSGGTHTVNGQLLITGSLIPPSPGSYVAGSYNLSGGTLSASSISSQGVITQSGGTNQVAGELDVATGYWPGSSYNLRGGLLTDSNLTLFPAAEGGFHQTGGTHIVSNLLRITGYNFVPYPGYELKGGDLAAASIQVDSGGSFHHLAGNLTLAGTLTLANGTWVANTNQQAFCQLMLGVMGGTNSTLSLPSGPCVLRFADSSELTWSNRAVLIIENWNGSFQGGGRQQIIFGNNASALTAQQLPQIQFRNPAGTTGSYPARILATGEVVPGPFLASQQDGGDLVLRWDPGCTLQTATNICGPYTDLGEVSSPYTNHASLEPARFFRLRQ